VGRAEDRSNRQAAVRIIQRVNLRGTRIGLGIHESTSQIFSTGLAVLTQAQHTVDQLVDVIGGIEGKRMWRMALARRDMICHFAGKFELLI
jgi:hypothetical protein